MSERPVWLSALLIVGTIAAGLALRLLHFGLPFVITKYGGSILWALMIYWIVSTAQPRWPKTRGGLVSVGIAVAVELFKLYHAPQVEALRRTLAGTLLLGRVFSWADLLAYSVAIGIGFATDRCLRMSNRGG